MSADDLAMVNFHRAGDGSWSWTAYRKPMEMWRSNTSCSDIFECVEQIVWCLDEQTAVEERARAREVDENAAAFGWSDDASGGMKSKPAAGKGGKPRKRQTSKTRTL